MTQNRTAGPTRRELFEAQQRWRSIRIAATSTVLVVVALIVLVPLAPGWAKVQQSFFNGEVLVKTFPKLLEAFKINVMIFAWSAPAIAVLGLLIALARDTKSPALFPLRIFGAAFTDIFRGVPVILTVYLIGFGIPGLGLTRPWNSPYIWGSLALILTYSAYVAEIFRSGIDSVHHSQRAAATPRDHQRQIHRHGRTGPAHLLAPAHQRGPSVVRSRHLERGGGERRHESTRRPPSA